MPVRPHYQGKVLGFLARDDELYLTSFAVTSEEITAKRREQRKRFKMDRANAIVAAAAAAEEAFRAGKSVPSPITIPSGATWKSGDETSEKQPPTLPRDKPEENWNRELDDVVDVEHLQLTPQEAFFLIWCFDCLSVLDPHTVCFHTHHDLLAIT
jgi:tRNA-splicing endonuclease subunit Sen2